LLSTSKESASTAIDLLCTTGDVVSLKPNYVVSTLCELYYSDALLCNKLLVTTRQTAWQW